jgi:hypothetical protein
MKIINVRNPVKISDTQINCEINLEGHGWCHFVARPNDPEEHGRAIFADLCAGKYGEPAVFAPDPALIRDMCDRLLRRKVSDLLRNLGYDDVGQLSAYAAQPGHKWHDEAVATLATITRWWDAWDNLADDDLVSPGFNPAAWVNGLRAAMQ